MFALPAAATVVAGIFAAATARRAPRSAAMAAWSFALAQFAVASAALAWGVARGWSPPLYRVFYLFGAIVNVIWLGLGTIVLLSRNVVVRRTVLALVVGLSVFATVVAARTPFVAGAAHALAAERVPRPSHVMPDGVRLLGVWYSIGGSVVVLAGLVWSLAVRRRHALGLGLLAVGVVVVGVAGELAHVGIVAGFSAGLAAGIAVMYAGFLRTQG